jgi:peptidoglycan/LPS O-acetylase OafA/YrhL
MPKPTMMTTAASRLPFVDALRALTATLVVWHHFALYGPLWSRASPEPGRMADWLRDYRSVVQVFFVISGFVMARVMSPRIWSSRHVGWFVVRRYCRLGFPYLGAIALAVVACGWARGWLSESVIGFPPTVPQVLAHIVFAQDILGYDSLSAGFWFVCIDFQLGLIYAGMLYLRDTLSRLTNREQGECSHSIPMTLGWALAAASLFFFNVHERFDVWGVYFFGQFFMGVMVHHALRKPELQVLFWLYVLAVAAALAYCWRWRLAVSLAAGLLLFFAGKHGLLERWPASRLVSYLGQTSYSLFLVHFPVLVIVSTAWLWLDRASVWDARIGLSVAYVASLVVADLFYRAIEAPAARLSHRFS